MSLIEKIDKNRLPRHVAIIMDGNGRWAKAKGKDRSFGHQEGVVSVRKIMDAVTQLGLKYLTLYTFSTENWNRPEEEVQALMSLLVSAIHRETPDMMKKNVRLTAIGDLSRLREDAYNTLQECIDTTSANTGTTLVLALSYSSRWEITRAARLSSMMIQLLLMAERGRMWGRYGIIASRRPGVTTKDAPQGEPAALENAVGQHSLYGIG